jgi:hypothetical protein
MQNSLGLGTFSAGNLKILIKTTKLNTIYTNAIFALFRDDLIYL